MTATSKTLAGPAPSESTPLLQKSKSKDGDRSTNAPSSHGTIERGLADTTTPSTNDDGEPEVNYAKIMPIILSIWVGVFLAAIDGTVIVTITGSVAASFRSFGMIGWIASAYFIALAAIQPLAGKLTDIFGRRHGLLVANAAFLVGNLICGIATSAEALIFGRIVAGMGGGGLTAIGMFVLSDLVPLRSRGIWQGATNIAYGSGSSMGALLGGYINDTWGWRHAFLIQVPMVLVSTMCVVSFVNLDSVVTPTVAPSINSSSSSSSVVDEEERQIGSDPDSPTDSPVYSPIRPSTPQKQTLASQLRRVDFLGAGILVFALVVMLMILNLGGDVLPWTHPLVLVSIPITLASLAAFVYVEASVAREPIIPVRLFTDRTVLASLTGGLLCNMAFVAILFYAPLYFQARGISATVTGTYMIVLSAGCTTGSLAAGFAMWCTGTYMGFHYAVNVLQVAAYVAIYHYYIPGVAVAVNVALLFVVGVALAAFVNVTLISLISAVDPVHQAAITSASLAFRSSGSTVSVAIVTGVFQSIFRSGLVDRFGHDGSADTDEIIERIKRTGLDELNRLPASWRDGVLEAYFLGLRGVWATALVFAVLAFAASVWMKDNSLNRRPAKP